MCIASLHSTPLPVAARARVADRLVDLPPQAYFVGSALFHYLGPAFAVLLFARVEPLGVAWLRIVSAGLVFVAWRRPWRTLRRIEVSTLRLLIGLGAVLAVMNSCFYVAIDRLPLGTVAAIEFLPVIVLAALGVRSLRNGVALALAVTGVYLLTNVRLEGEPLGVAFAFANAALFALYIVLAHRVARASGLGRIDGLAAAMVVASLVITPLAGGYVAPVLLDPVAIACGIGVGITSSVIPYVCDQLAMTRLSRATYSLMISLLPATATAIGIVVLAQIPNVSESVGVALVVLAVGVHRERSEPTEQPRPATASDALDGSTSRCGRRVSPQSSSMTGSNRATASSRRSASSTSSTDTRLPQAHRDSPLDLRARLPGVIAGRPS